MTASPVAIQVPGDLPVAFHKPDLAAGSMESVGRELHDVRAMARGQERIDKGQLELDLSLVRGAEQENLRRRPAEPPAGGRPVQSGDDRLRGSGQVRSLRLDSHHRSDVGAGIGQRLQQVVADLAGGAGHEDHGH